MPKRLAQNIRSILTLRELAAAIKSERDAGRKITESLLLRSLERELHRYHWNYEAASLEDLNEYLELLGQEEPEYVPALDIPNLDSADCAPAA
jgi:hypothetical protein